MKNLIKKILKEEFGDDLDWIRSQEPQEWEKFMFPYINLTPKMEKTSVGDRLVYRDENGNWIFYHEKDPKNGYIWFNYNKIWGIFESKFGYNYKEIKDLLVAWVEEHYDLSGVTPRIPDDSVDNRWGDTII
jgi:hypothetical protein